MKQIVRHFATRLKRAAKPARSATASFASLDASAWDRFDQWLALEPVTDLLTAYEMAIVREDARLTIALIGQAGEEVVSRISRARSSDRLMNEGAAQFALAFALQCGDAGTRSAASQELSVKN